MPSVRSNFTSKQANLLRDTSACVFWPHAFSQALFVELVKFWLNKLYVLSMPKFYVATAKTILKYFRLSFCVQIR